MHSLLLETESLELAVLSAAEEARGQRRWEPEHVSLLLPRFSAPVGRATLQTGTRTPRSVPSTRPSTGDCVVQFKTRAPPSPRLHRVGQGSRGPNPADLQPAHALNLRRPTLKGRAGLCLRKKSHLRSDFVEPALLLLILEFFVKTCPCHRG